jgi:hypothetical protein
MKGRIAVIVVDVTDPYKNPLSDARAWHRARYLGRYVQAAR